MASQKREQAPALQGRLSPARREDKSRSLALLGMTNHESRVTAHASLQRRAGRRTRPAQEGGTQERPASEGRALHTNEETESGSKTRRGHDGSCPTRRKRPKRKAPASESGRYREERAVSLAWGTDFCWRRTWKRSPMPSGKMSVLSCRRARTRSVSSMPSS